MHHLLQNGHDGTENHWFVSTQGQEVVISQHKTIKQDEEICNL